MVAVAERSFMRRGADVFESRRVLAAALIAPAVIFILLLVGTPFVLAIYLSFTDATAGSLSGSWVGFHNFASEWHNPIFRHAVRNTIVMTLSRRRSSSSARRSCPTTWRGRSGAAGSCAS